jgi:uncharacterized protein YgiM (DUF1202 family)
MTRVSRLLRPFAAGAMIVALSLGLLPLAATAQEVRLERAGLPDTWVVRGITAAETLDLRVLPGTMFDATGTVRLNETVRNIGCAEVFGTRWCKVQKLTGNRAEGFLRARYLAEPATVPVDPVITPEFWQIVGLSATERLNIRAAPSAQSRILGNLRNGERVRNEGCQIAGSSRWCRITALSGSRVTGFVSARYLRPWTGQPAPPPPVDDDLAGGPEFWQIVGVAPNDRLNIRATPSIQSRILGTLRNGERVRNQGCEMVGATRWCAITALSGSRVSGYVVGRYLREWTAQPAPPPPPTDDDLAGGPDFWRVRGLPAGDVLNVRQAPTVQSRVLATLREGERVRNLGCEMRGSTRWCLIRSTTGVDVTGYVNGRYLRE